ncbi:MAG: helix-turn-helix transcriptional regulator [Caulobacteraceae bacterium]
MSNSDSRAREFRADVAEILDGSPNAVFLLDPESRIRHVNRAGAEMLAEAIVLCREGQRLSAVDEVSSRRLAALIRNAAVGEAGGTMPLASHTGGPPLAVSAVGLHPDPGEESARSVIVWVKDLAAKVAVSEQALRDLFGLSPAEARVALALFDGRSQTEAAVGLGLSFFTVRNHLGRVYQKTRTRGRSDLVRLMVQISGAQAV